MIREAIDRIIGLAAPNYYDYLDKDGNVALRYSDKSLHLIKPPRAAALEFYTLQGLVDYVRLDLQRGATTEGRVIHVKSPDEVIYESEIDAAFRDRETFAVAQHDPRSVFAFGAKLDPEMFNIHVQTHFAEYGDRTDKARLQELVGKLGAESKSETEDDGISQSVTLKAGVTLQRRAQIANPFKLAPFRTFPEIEQPIGPFIFRVHQAGANGVTCCLYECDNNAWKIDAVHSIADWLKDKVDVPVLA